MLFSVLRGNMTFSAAFTSVLAILVVIFVVLPFHEWAHAFTASKLGDKSVKYRGRLTLNPMAHIDPFGALALLLFGFGWAKPVPVDPSNFKKPKLGMGIVALMGPVANIVAAIVGGLFYYGIGTFAPTFYFSGRLGHYTYLFLTYYVIINIRLAVFNLLPIPPLDGSKILFVFLPDKWVNWFYQYQQTISIVLIALLWIGSYIPVFPFNILIVVLHYLSNQLLTFVSWITSLPFSFFW